MARGLDIPLQQGVAGEVRLADGERVTADLSAMSDHEIFAAATDELRRLFRSGFPPPRATKVTRWNADPFARGSYSFNAVGLGTRERRALAMPQ